MNLDTNSMIAVHVNLYPFLTFFYYNEQEQQIVRENTRHCVSRK